MTIAVSTNKVVFQGNGATTVFTYSFAMPANSAQLYFTDASGNQTLIASNLYSITGVGQPTAGGGPQGGTVTYPLSGPPIAVGTLLTLVRMVPDTQQNSFTNQGGLWPLVVEQSDDNLEMQIQQIAEIVSRALVVSVSETGPEPPLPPAVLRANKYLTFDSLGNPTVGAPITNATVSLAMAPVVGASTTALALALLGAVAPVANIAALRTLNTAASLVWVRGYSTAGDGGEGMFNIGAPASDNGGTIIVSQNGTYYRETQGHPYSVKQFGAKGDAVTDDTAAVSACFQAAIALNGRAYLPACAGYRITTPINLSNCAMLTIQGDSAYPCTARITPNFGSTLIGETGAGHCVIDASGASGLKITGVTIASIGKPNASTIGIFLGATTIQNGSNCVFEDTSILLPATGSSVGIYGVSANLGTARGLMIMADAPLILTDTTANALNLNPPYGVWGANVQSDGWSTFGCMLLGYGTLIPLSLINVGSHLHDQLYIVNLNGGVGYTGQPYAMSLSGCTDVRIKVEIDYFPCAFAQGGAWFHTYLDGIIFQGDTPLANTLPVIGLLAGVELEDCRINIRGISNFGAGYFLYTSAGGGSPTLTAIFNTEFWFNNAVAASAGFFNFSNANPVPFFNCKLDGNTDITNGFGITIEVDGSSAATSTYRLLMNSKLIGSA